MWTVQTSFNIPEQVFSAGTVNRSKLWRWHSIVVSVAKRIWLQSSTLFFIVKHKSAINEFDVVHIVRRTSSSKDDSDLIASWYESLRRNESAQIVSRLPRRRWADFEERLFVTIRVNVNYFNDTSTWRWPEGQNSLIKLEDRIQKTHLSLKLNNERWTTSFAFPLKMSLQLFAYDLVLESKCPERPPYCSVIT